MTESIDLKLENLTEDESSESGESSEQSEPSEHIDKRVPLFLAGFFHTIERDEKKYDIIFSMIDEAKTSSDLKFLAGLFDLTMTVFNRPEIILENEARLQMFLEAGIDINHVEIARCCTCNNKRCGCEPENYPADEDCRCLCNSKNREFLLFCDLSPEQLKLALDNNADLHKDVEGRKAVHVYSEIGSVDQLGVLIEYGADISAVASNGGMQPIHVACKSGDIKIVEFLIENGADICAKDSKGRNCIWYAEKCIRPNFKIAIEELFKSKYSFP